MGKAELLEKAISRYIADKNELRLNAILQSHGVKATKTNVSTLKLLISDYQTDSDLKPLQNFVGIEEEQEKELPPVVIEDIVPNDDDFIRTVIQQLGDTKDQSSLGNRVLRGETTRFNIQSYIKPDVLLRKYAVLTGKDALEIEFYPRSMKGVPVWEVVVAGMGTLARENRHKID